MRIELGPRHISATLCGDLSAADGRRVLARGRRGGWRPRDTAIEAGRNLAVAAGMRWCRFPIRRVLCLAATVFLTTLAASCGGSPTAPDNSPSAAPVQDPAIATSLTYSADVQPLLNNDCVR